MGTVSADDGSWGQHANVVVIIFFITPFVLAVLLNVVDAFGVASS
jgi:hypothetical protein